MVSRRRFAGLAAAAAAAGWVRPWPVAAAEGGGALDLGTLAGRLRGGGETLGPGTYRLTGETISVAGESLAASGAGSRATTLVAGGLPPKMPLFELGPGAELSLTGLAFTGGGAVVRVPAVDGGTDTPSQPPAATAVAAGLTLEDVSFTGLAAPVTMTNDGFHNAAVGGLRHVAISHCRVSDTGRGFMLGDAGSYRIETVDIADLAVERAGRFGLFIGGTREAGTAVTEHVRITGFRSRDLDYVKGTNCAHLYVAGRNVTLTGIELSGARLADPAIAGESDKEGLYLKCRNADLSGIRIVDTLADQGALVLKGEAYDATNPKPQGGDYRIRDLTVVQSSPDQPPMRGIWLQTGPASLSGGRFEGLGRQAIAINGAAFDGIRLEDVEIQRHGFKTAIAVSSRAVRHLTVSRCTVSPAAAAGGMAGIAFFAPKGGGPLEAIAIEDCRFALGRGTGSAGIQLNLGPRTRLAGFSVSRCRFAGDHGLEVRGTVGDAAAEIAVAECDFTGLADPSHAVVFLPRASNSADGGTAPEVVFSGENAGIVLNSKGILVIAEDEQEVEASLPLTLFQGFDPMLDSDDVLLACDAGNDAVRLSFAAADRLRIRRADPSRRVRLAVSFEVSKRRWRGTSTG
jgi:hypothetical protein